MVYWSIDRFEGDFALCETPDNQLRQVPRSLLPREAQEGDCIYFDENGKIYIDPKETQRRREIAKKYLKHLFRQ